MPTLITYERERLSEAQYQALGVYFARKKLKERANENGVASHKEGENTTDIQDITPAKPSAEEIREKKEKSLNDTKEQLAELELMLCKLKEKKHELFEELKCLVHSKKVEKERQMQPCQPSPFMPHAISPGATMMNVTTFRPGMKRPKSPSPPLVQLYSPLQTSPYPPLANRMPGPPESMNPGYPFPQNYPLRDAHQQIQGPQANPPANSPRPPGNYQFPPHDRNFSPFGNYPMLDHRLSVNVSPPNLPRPPLANQPLFMHQNMQQNTTNESLPGFSPTGKDRQGFGNPSGHRPQGFSKRDNHGPSRPRYY